MLVEDIGRFARAARFLSSFGCGERQELVMASVVSGFKDKVYLPDAKLAKHAHVGSLQRYREMHKLSVEKPEEFWKEHEKQFYWKSPPSGPYFSYNFDVLKGPISIKWLEGAKTNICYNVLDYNITKKKIGKNIAFYWEGNEPDDSKTITYDELLEEVCKFANVLKNKGIKKGDRVAIYMPMVLELVVAMLATVRIGAVHSIIFGGFSSGSLSERVLDSKSSVLITADGTWRGTKLINLKEIADDALAKCKASGHTVKTCIIVKHLGTSESNPLENGTAVENNLKPPSKRTCHDFQISWNEGVDHWWHELMEDSSTVCDVEWVDAEDPLFMLYTSGSTGKPKGVLHTVGGYMLYAAATFKYVFDYHSDDIYWCTADIGWITGHTYVSYGPLLNGATSVIFEGVPFHPDAGRCWAIVDKYKVTKFYTAPTAIRALMKFGDSFVTKYKRDTLKVLGSVGEPINPEAWLWYHDVVGNGKCPVVDTFWQTETGGHVITPLPGAIPTKPGAATFPFFGVEAILLNEEGKEIKGPGEGYLVFKKPWPGMMRSVYGNHDRFEKTYFLKFPGYYCTGDGARRDEDGYYWITGRVDDMLNVSGHLLSTAEVETALLEHSAVSEAAAVAHPHKIKGECLYCFITLKEGHEFGSKLVTELKNRVRGKIGPFASPEYIQYAPNLPKTRSGKIMRRILRKVSNNDRDLGDTSTLADESVIDQLFKFRPAELAEVS